MTYRLAVAVAAALSVGVTPAFAQLATFDDLASCNDTDNFVSLVPNGYAGFSWSNFYAGHGANTATRTGGTGYANGTVSDPCMALNGFGNPAEISATESFIFNGGFFTAAFTEGLSLQVVGYAGAVELFSTFMVLSTAGPQLMNVAWEGVDRVTFESGTGTPGSQFVFDNFRFNNTPDPNIPPTVAPEPVSLLLLGTGLAGVAAVRRRRKVTEV